ncbi:MAG: hypothetical protein DMG91_16760 [Acidobacteria bacterium]|nr:MAG: hypothetical protein DMG91_16760 [Acidobacteriota bacterium]
MARKNAPTILQEELYPPSEQVAREEVDDARLRDLDAEQESPFLRGQKRVSARRGTLPKKTANRLAWIAASAIVVFLCIVGVAALYHYGERSWRFRIDSSDDIEVNGMQNVTRAQIMEAMGGDIGRNIFFIPLAQRKAQLEQIPWVESASVMRFVPNHLRIEIHERTPVAFARIGSKILLVDGVGTLMELPPKKKYSFPVVIGMNPGEPLSTRLARMKIYNEVVHQLDSGGARYSQDLSEIDLSDPEDIKVLANNTEGEVLIHLGASNYLERYKIYVSHVQQWRQQFQKLESVDLRYERQIIVNPDTEGAPKQPPLSVAAAKKAMAAGVKPAALITGRVYGPKPLPPGKPLEARKPAKSAKLHRARSRPRARVVTHLATKQSEPAQVSKKPSPSIARQQN